MQLRRGVNKTVPLSKRGTSEAEGDCNAADKQLFNLSSRLSNRSFWVLKCYEFLGVILRLFSQLSEFLLCSFVTRKNQSAGTEIRDSNKALRTRSLYFRRCCLYAANSGTEQLAARAHLATLFPNAQTSSVLFPRLPLTTTHAHTVPFFRRYSCCGFP